MLDYCRSLQKHSAKSLIADIEAADGTGFDEGFLVLRDEASEGGCPAGNEGFRILDGEGIGPGGEVVGDGEDSGGAFDLFLVGVVAENIIEVAGCDVAGFGITAAEGGFVVHFAQAGIDFVKGVQLFEFDEVIGLELAILLFLLFFPGLKLGEAQAKGPFYFLDPFSFLGKFGLGDEGGRSG